MTLRHAIVIYFVSLIIETVGVLFKVLHLPGADEVLIFAAIIQTVGLIIIIMKVLKHPKLKDFLDH